MSVFAHYQPARWEAAGRVNYSTRRDHSVETRFVLHNPNSPVNRGRGTLEQVLVEYVVHGNGGSISHELYTARDLEQATYRDQLATQAGANGNLAGDIAERIARRITKYWLKHHSKHGEVAGIFDRRFRIRSDDYIVANTADLILKVQRYPQMVLLRKTGKGKLGYENIKELDGLFDYRFFRKRHLLVLESKLGDINADPDRLVTNLFEPLRTLFPDASLSYILFGAREEIYKDLSLRILKPRTTRLSLRLARAGVGTLFFTFNETRAELDRISKHVTEQYRRICSLQLTLRYKTLMTDGCIEIYDGGERPIKTLVRDADVWREQPEPRTTGAAPQQDEH